MKVCRVCLSRDYFSYLPLFSFRGERTIAKTIMLCTGIKINPNDGITQMVCGYCTDEFLKFFKLRQQCLEADTFLRKDLRSEIDLSDKILPEESLCNEALLHEGCKMDNEQSTAGPESKLDDEFKLLEVVQDPKSEIMNEEWVVAEVEIVKAEYEDFEALEDPDFIDLQEDAHISLGSEEESKPSPRLKKKHRNAGKTPRKRKKVLAFGVGRDPSSKFICCSCPSEAFESQNALEFHRTDQHEKYRIADNVIRPYECDVCFQRFLTEKHLAQHKARPYKKREYVCTSCGNAFLASSTLKKHEEICVTTDRNYACEECGKRFTQIGSLRNHLKLHNSEKTHSCPICGKTFLKKFEVPIHMVTHTEEQPFPCDQCPARFKRKQALRNHQRHHSNPTPYKCDMCDEWFNNFSARKFHRQRVHEGIDPFKCDQCGASYGRKNRLDQHVKKVHSRGA